MEHRGEPVKPLARTQEWNNLYRQPLQKNAAFTERTALRHLTPEEIALNQQELACSAEIEQLEMQETSLDYELERDIDETRRMIIVQTLRVLYKALLTQYRELARVRGA
jgi:hypothetical protein